MLAPTVDVLATVFSAGYLYSRAQTSHEYRTKSLEEQTAGTDLVEALWRRVEALEEAVTERENDPTEPTPAPAVESFAERNRVRFPGGGDWLSRERNRRTGSVTYTVPEGAWVAEAHTRILADNSGGLGGINFEDPLDGVYRMLLYGHDYIDIGKCSTKPASGNVVSPLCATTPRLWVTEWSRGPGQ